jgi:hypothetical protein
MVPSEENAETCEGYEILRMFNNINGPLLGGEDVPTD